MQLAILVVDDKPEACLALIQWLTEKGHHVEAATDGREALALIGRRRTENRGFDIVLADMVMPNMDGLTLGREVRLRKDACVLVLITGFGAINPRLAEDSRAIGFLTVLDKPIEFQRLDAIVNAIANEKASSAPPTSSGGADPFFGTSRIIRNTRQTPLGQQATPEPGPALSKIASSDPFDDYSPTQGPEIPGLSGSSVHTPGTGRLAPGAPVTGGWRKQKSDPAQPATESQAQSGYTRKRSDVFLDQSMQPQGAPGRPGEPGRTPTNRYDQPPVGGFTSGHRRGITPASGTKPSGGTTGVYRRSVEPVKPPSVTPGLGTTVPVPGQTARIRRGIDQGDAGNPGTGAIANPTAFTVACAFCGKGFVVAARTTGYNAPCIHCGGLNRIEPVPPG